MRWLSRGSLCSHLMESGHLARPFALVYTNLESLYACPSCFADKIEEMQVSGASRQPITSTFSFRHCDHEGSNGPACWSCLEAVKAELTLYWSRVIHADNPRANRLRKVRNFLSKTYDFNKIMEAGRQRASSKVVSRSRTPKSFMPSSETAYSSRTTLMCR